MLAESSNIAAFVPPLLSKVVVPLTVNTPLSVIAPPEVMAKIPLTVLAPKSAAPASVTATFAPVKLKVPKVEAD